MKVLGSGASETIVDGRQTGSVLTIGKNYPKADVTLSGMTIQGGFGTQYAVWPEHIGCGILDFGTIKVIDSTISGNGNLAVYGGGIYNGGTAIISGSTISKNNAGGGGAICNDRAAKLDVSNSIISENTALLEGGGILNWAA